MAKFTSEQVLDLFRSDLERRLKADESSASSMSDPNYRLSLEVRVSLLRDLVNCLYFYTNYEFD